MKSITEHMQEALGIGGRSINEAKKCVVNSIPDCPDNADNEYEVQPAIDKCYEIAGTLEDTITNMKLLKKVKAFKGYDQKTLHDYAVCLEQIGAWINGVMSLAEDEISEARMYVNTVKDINTDSECWENSVEEVDPAEFDSITGNEDIYDYFDDIKNNWNDVCKAIFKMPWD